MTKTVEETAVRKSVRVQAPIERAFSMFVEQMETWWPPEHHIGGNPFQSIIVEPRTGGRWYERDAKGNDCDWGRVLAWDPPHRVTFSWHLGVDWKVDPDIAHASEVEIRFSPDGSSGTLVELEHRRLERHGEGYERLRMLLDGPDAWQLTLASFAKAANGGPGAEAGA
jgi:uncharacterized protein YndB with AHSA1/START domain